MGSDEDSCGVTRLLSIARSYLASEVSLVSKSGSNSAAFRIEEKFIRCLHLMHGGDSLVDSKNPESVTMYLAPQWSHFQGTWVGRD